VLLVQQVPMVLQVLVLQVLVLQVLVLQVLLVRVLQRFARDTGVTGS
jgi:hypothetical protein